MFERFTPEARAVVTESQLHVRRLRHRFIGTEHLLLALCAPNAPTALLFERFGVTVASVEQGIAACYAGSQDDLRHDRDALASLGIDLDQVRAAAESTFGPGALDIGNEVTRTHRRRWRRRERAGRCTHPPTAGHVPFSSRAKKCLELSLREALRLHPHVIAPEHIALGVLREGEGLACLVLDRHGVPRSELRAAIEAQAKQAWDGPGDAKAG